MTQGELFQSASHDPGGKVRTLLPAGMHGDAVLAGDQQQFRPLLRRWTGVDFPLRYAVFIGMNPSTADHRVNDSTVTREWGFTVREGFAGYVKCNVSDYRATNPAQLLEAGLVLESDGNRQTILQWAAGAGVVVACWGSVNRALEPLAAAVCQDLAGLGVEVWCFGRNANSSPKHPLYLASSTPLERFL